MDLPLAMNMQKQLYIHLYSSKRIAVAIFFSILFIATGSFALWAITKAEEQSSNEDTTWVLTAPIPSSAIGARLAGSNRKLFVIGGKRSYPGKEVIYSTVPQSNTVLASWNRVPISNLISDTFPSTLELHAVAQNKEYVYILGGWDTKLRSARVWRMQNGDLPNCCTEVRSLLRAVVAHEAIVAGNRIVTIGGYDENNKPLADVASAKIDTKGDLHDWRNSTPLNSPRVRHAVAAMGNQVFVSGGYDGATARREIYCGIVTGNDELAIAEWKTIGNLKEAMYYHQMVIQKGRLFIIGGQNDESSYSEVYSTEVPSRCDGLGDWKPEPSLPLTLSRHTAITITHGLTNSTYIVGGVHNDIGQSQVYFMRYDPPKAAIVVASPSPTPGLALLQLSNRPDDALASEEEVTYYILYKNGTVPLENLQIISELPQQLELVNLIHSSDVKDLEVHQYNDNHELVWTIMGTLPADFQGLLSYSVRNMGTADLITNPGVKASWSYENKEDSMTSNPTFNPSEKQYLPIIQH